MKLLILIIAVIFMSVFSDSIYAQSEPIEPQGIDVTGVDDEELRELKRLAEETDIIEGNASEKIELIDSIQKAAQKLVPKQIDLITKKQKLKEFYEARDKYILCIQKKGRDCSELRQKVDDLISGKQPHEKEQDITKNTYITNRPKLEKIKRCLNIVREVYPDFEARITVRMNVDQVGFPTSAQVVEESSNMSPYFANFPQCVAQFSKELKYKNPNEERAEVTQTFVF